MDQPPLLQFIQVSKAFGSVSANQNVSFSVEAGSIHALVGENGAGKSTIMKILFGMYQRDGGDIRMNGRSIHFYNSFEAKQAGIGMVHQHFMLAGPLTALDHIFLDGPCKKNLFSRLNKTSKLKELENLSKNYGMPVPWNEKIENLSVGFQQRVEILKLLHNQSRILILDEPTAVLTPQEVQTLFTQLRSLKSSGHTVILITHKLAEVAELADTVSIFRQGQVVQTCAVKTTTAIEMSEWMIGRELGKIEKNPVQLRSESFELRNLTHAKSNLQNLNLKIQGGEIVGIAGVEGNGQSELIQILLNPSKFQDFKGEIFWNQNSIRFDKPQDLKRKSFSYLPEDRLDHGSLIGMNLKENFLLGQERSNQFQRKGFLNWNAIEQATVTAIQKFDVRPDDSNQNFANLSGGNQQKLVAAREFSRNPKFLLAAQPTRGVDIGSIERLHLEILKWRDLGCPILLISSELEELIKLSDRIVVIFKGQFVGEMDSSSFDEMKLGKWMTGVSTGPLS